MLHKILSKGGETDQTTIKKLQAMCIPQPTSCQNILPLFNNDPFQPNLSVFFESPPPPWKTLYHKKKFEREVEMISMLWWKVIKVLQDKSPRLKKMWMHYLTYELK